MSFTFNNVMVGEVWVLLWTIQYGLVRQAFSKSGGGDPKRRIIPISGFLRSNALPHNRPAQDVEGTWSVCDTSSVGNFSAVAYYFGRRLHKTLNMPIGLINTSWGGTPAEAWTSLPAPSSHTGVCAAEQTLGRSHRCVSQSESTGGTPGQDRRMAGKCRLACVLWGNAVREGRGEIRIVPIVRLCSTMG